MFAILAEDRSDANSLANLVKRIGQIESRIMRKGFSGCGELCRKASAHILNFADQGATHFIICQDSDGHDPVQIRNSICQTIERKINLNEYDHLIVVPVQELEAWLIADESALQKVIPSFKLQKVNHPETIQSPKEWLIQKSRTGRSKPLYSPVTHNEKVSAHLDIDTVKSKCNSFSELVAFVEMSGVH